MGRLPEALASAEKSINSAIKLHNKDHLLVAIATMYKARIHKTLVEDEEAAKAYKRVV